MTELINILTQYNLMSDEQKLAYHEQLKAARRERFIARQALLLKSSQGTN